MDFSARRRYYNFCDPNEPLSPDDDRNVDLDRWGDGTIRAAHLFEGLASDFELSDAPLRKLFTGLPGSGKSTELRRLAERLADPRGLRLLPVIADAEELLDLHAAIDVPDVMMAIVFAVERAVLEVEGRTGAPMGEGYFSRLWNWLTRTDVELAQTRYSIPGAPQLVAELKTRPSLRARVREAVASNLNEFLREVREELRALERRVVSATTDGRPYGGLVVIFDSLEKLAGTATTATAVLDSAQLFFRRDSPWLELPVHVVYTVPPALMTRVAGVEFMPMIKVRDRDGRPFAAGVEAARSLIEKRIETQDLPAIFGGQWEARVSELISWSGGYPRELVRLLRKCLRYKAHPLSEEDFARVFEEIIAEYRRMVLSEDFAWLAGVARSRWVSFDTPDHQASADRLLSINAILYYPNGQGFYDLHPALYQIPGIQAALSDAEP